MFVNETRDFGGAELTGNNSYIYWRLWLFFSLLFTILFYYAFYQDINDCVHRCGASGSMHTCHAAGPGSISGSGQVSWVRFSRVFSSPVRQMSGNFRPPRSPNIIWTSSLSFHIRLVGMTVCLVCIVFHVCAVSEVAPVLGWSLVRGGPPCPCVVKKVCMWSIV